MKCKCKFCGCTEEKPCLLRAVDGVPDRDEYLRAGGSIVIEPGVLTHQVPCAWLVFNPLGDGVCSNPSCVEKAYLEARPLAESIDEALRMEEAA